MIDQERLERTQILTRFFGEMQGLRAVPIGTFLLLDAGYVWVLRSTSLMDRYEFLPPLVLILMLLLTFMASSWVSRYYLLRYGRVNMEEYPKGRLLKVWLIVVMVASVLLDTFLKPPILLSGFVFAAFIWAGLTKVGKARKDYLWAGILTSLTAFLPMLGLDIRESLNIFIAVLGAVMVFAGLTDHFKLQQLFKLQELSYDR